MVSRYRSLTARVCVALLLTLTQTPLWAENADSPRTIGTHANGIASVHYSPDGKLLATGGGDKIIRVWDVATAKPLHEWDGPSSFTCAVRFSPDGRTLVAAGYESGAGNAIYRFDVVSGKELPKLPGHPTGGVRRVAFTPDGKQLVSAGFDGMIRIWDLAANKEVRHIKVETGTVYSLALSPDGKIASTAGRDGLKLWELRTGREIRREAMNKHSCVSVTFGPDGKIVASGDGNTVRLWELATGKEIQTLKGFKGELSQMIFSADGRTLYTSSYDRKIRLWEVRTGRMIHEVEAHTGWVWGISLSPDEKHLASCSVDTKLLCWNLAGLGRPTATNARLSRGEIEAHLLHLGSSDAGKAYRAICALAGDPNSSLPLLQQRLTTVRLAGPTPTEMAQMVKDLDSDSYRVRETAFQNLARAGAAALPVLQKTLAKPESLEVRKRVQRLLARLDPTELPADELIAVRGVQTLEYIGTSEARRVLEKIANREGSPRLSNEASQALLRLTQTEER